MTRLGLLFALAWVAGCVGDIAGQGDPNQPPGSGPGPGAGPAPGGPGPGGGTPGPGGGNPGPGPGPGPGAGPARELPGNAPLRRLTRPQYNNTIRDLLGVTGTPASGFGLDEEDGGFVSNAKAPVKELQIEHYQRAAEELATQAVANIARVAPCAAGRPEATCVDDFVKNFGKRAHRRPLDPTDVDGYKRVYAAAKGTTGDFAAGIQGVISAMLQSPWFLYRVEIGTAGTPATADGLALDRYEIASRLSYFIQNTMPDEELFAAADANRLRTPEEISTQARRLLGSPKAKDTVASFFEQWLHMDDLASLEKDPKAYAAFTPDVRNAMRDELIEFADHVTRAADGKLETLLTANFTFLRGPLYGVYGMPAATGAAAMTPRRVDLPPGQRAGIMTLASVMAKHAHPDQSSPVGRGVLMLEKILCITPDPPPPGADDNLPKPDPNSSTRERFAMHRTRPDCNACHSLIDPLGLPFEIYDGMGRHRTTDGGKPVDATSELRLIAAGGPVKDAPELMRKLAVSPEVRECMARQWYRFAFGRGEVDEDQGTIATALDAFGRAESKLPELIVALTTTKGFRHRKPVRLQ